MEEEPRNASPYCNGEDRISRLQDELIHHIMSFNDTKYAVQTSVLSKRWIDIWKSLPFLNFNRDSFAEDKKRSFIMFVDMVFIRRHKDFDIQKFRLDWVRSSCDNMVTMHVNRWSLNVVQYNVQEIWIEIGQLHNSAYEIPHGLLNCKSVSKLEMLVFGNGRYADIILPSSISLPQLKELYICGFSISDVESSKRLFSSCPTLETLFIIDCNIQSDNQGNLIVDSVSLKYFVYSFRRGDLLLQNDRMANVVKLLAPNFKELTCGSFLTQNYSLEICSPLAEVYFGLIDVNACTYSNLSSKEKKVYAKRMVQYLAAVHNVEAMGLSPGFLEVLSKAPDLHDCPAPHLCNLKDLWLDLCSTRYCLRAIAYLLSICPNVREIYLDSKKSNMAKVGYGWEARLSSPGMLSRLEYVRIKEVEGCDAELKLLSFILENAKVLEQTDIYFRSSVVSTVRMKQVKRFKDKLRAVATASPSAQLVFV